ncbi:hypothetical protein F5884DRAFT_869574 [Xylogone sp. PMI_703]|nr:hypothetical protein F5884DRAFT_869574 [Xylogone sp. PMI_703]
MIVLAPYDMLKHIIQCLLRLPFEGYDVLSSNLKDHVTHQFAYSSVGRDQLPEKDFVFSKDEAANFQIIRHLSAAELDLNSNFQQLDPRMDVLNIPEELGIHSCSWIENTGKSLVVIFYLGHHLCGYAGKIHGGILATMLDDSFARYALLSLKKAAAFDR